MKKSLYYFLVLSCSSILIAQSNTRFEEATADGVPLQVLTPARFSQFESSEKNIEESDEDSEPKPVDTTPTFQNEWQTYRIQSGDNLSRIFAKFGIGTQTLQKILKSSPVAKELTAVYPGKEIEFRIDEAGTLTQLHYRPNKLDTLKVVRAESGYTIEKSSREVERRTAHANGLIRSSLYRDGKAAGLSDKLILEFAKIFAWDIDFALGIRPGDEFTVIYEQLFLDDQLYGTGNILAAEFINRGKAYTAVRFTNEEGVAGYYTPEGKGMRKAFLRTPVQFARISSHFNLHRRHPVLNRIRAHKGVDYAAPTGTPVRVTGDGKITFRGRKGGYGRVVVVQHGKDYSTLYAHLSRFGNSTLGSHVKQGQTIGYVGSSGLATGPHLHYEFRINGIHRNPLTVKLTHTLPIENESLDLFKASTTSLLSQLELYRTTLLAQADVKHTQTQ